MKERGRGETTTCILHEDYISIAHINEQRLKAPKGIKTKLYSSQALNLYDMPIIQTRFMIFFRRKER